MGGAQTETAPETVRWCAADVNQVLVESGWLWTLESCPRDPSLIDWINRAADLLAPHAKDRSQLIALLQPIFCYNAFELLQDRENQTVLARAGAREVIRELANHVLVGREIDSDRFKEIIDSLKRVLRYRSRALLHPIRLALAGRAGGGELDRSILLVDSASKLSFAVHVKSVRQRMLEFCSALD